MVGNSRTNPDGTKVVFRKGFANPKDSQLEVYCHIYDVQTEATYQLTMTGMPGVLRWLNTDTLAMRKRTGGIDTFDYHLVIVGGYSSS
jgi:hypothetical protein